MKKIIYTLFVIMFLASGLYSQEVKQNTVVVKFKPNSELARSWKSAGRKGEISVFSGLIGTNVSAPYIDDRLLQAVRKAKRKSTKKISQSSAEGSNIDLIARISYTAEIDPFFVAKKLATHPNVEFAEPETIKHIVSMPNDSLVGEQYYLNTVKAVEAWDLIDSQEPVIIGIVDTGIEYNHVDLIDNIYNNPGEVGLDQLGNDKKSNAIDDDNNGYVDDWMGWDFYADGDNDPRPGHLHGTHVAGICGAVINNKIGIAGVAPNVKLLPVKIGYDSQFATSTVNSYQGLLYAAAVGADIMNCSWGSATYSKAEEEIVAEAVSLGTLIVAAAGNDRTHQAHYPSSYKGVISVAATDSSDLAASFTNYHRSVDVSAPGVEIFSTIPISEYRNLDGTSMASPVAAGVAAMVRSKFPEKTNIQIGEILKVTADNIDTLNPFYAGKIGKGRVNAVKAMQSTNAVSLTLDSYNVDEEIKDFEYNSGEILSIGFSIQNILSTAENTAVKLVPANSQVFQIISDSIYIGKLEELETSFPEEKFQLRIKQGIGLDVKVELVFQITADGFYSEESFSITLSPSYKTMRGNKINTTFNSGGNIGFNDYPTNSQGVGFIYDNSNNLSFEGALMIGTENKNLYNSARTFSQYVKDQSFGSSQSFRILKPGMISAEDGSAFMSAHQNDMTPAKFDISQSVYQFSEDELSSIIFPTYTIINKSSEAIDSVFAGLYFDWDIAYSGRNQIWWDSVNYIGFAKYVDSDTIPITAAVLLSDCPINFFAMDNNGNTEENPGVYDGFTSEEKLRVISSGIGRAESAIVDASMVIAGGPISIAPNDSVQISFALISGYSLPAIIQSAYSARKTADRLGFGGNVDSKVYKSNAIANAFPNPASDNFTLKLNIIDDTVCDMIICDLLGKTVKTLAKDLNLRYGRHYFNYSVADLAIGSYFIVFVEAERRTSYPLVKIEL